MVIQRIIDDVVEALDAAEKAAKTGNVPEMEKQLHVAERFASYAPALGIDLSRAIDIEKTGYKIAAWTAFEDAIKAASEGKTCLRESCLSLAQGYYQRIRPDLIPEITEQIKSQFFNSQNIEQLKSLILA